MSLVTCSAPLISLRHSCVTHNSFVFFCSTLQPSYTKAKAGVGTVRQKKEGKNRQGTHMRKRRKKNAWFHNVHILVAVTAKQRQQWRRRRRWWWRQRHTCGGGKGSKFHFLKVTNNNGFSSWKRMNVKKGLFNSLWLRLCQHTLLNAAAVIVLARLLVCSFVPMKLNEM